MKRIRFFKTSNPKVRASKILKTSEKEYQLRINLESGAGSIVDMRANSDLFTIRGLTVPQTQKLLKSQLKVLGLAFDDETRGQD